MTKINYTMQYEIVLRNGIALAEEVEDANMRKDICDGINNRLCSLRIRAEREGFRIGGEERLSRWDIRLLELDARAQYRLIFGEEAA